MTEGQFRIQFKGGLNMSSQEVVDQIKANIKRPLPQAKPYKLHEETEIMLVGGGPSVLEYIDEIRQMREEGQKLITVNGSFDMMLDHGIIPSAFVMIDGREFNARFVARAKEASTCKFYISSQCHPSVFDSLEADGADVTIFHSYSKFNEDDEVGPNIVEKTLNSYYFGRAQQTYFFVLGGSTVVSRAIWLLRILGFKRQHIYGFDSCYMDGKHHAYEQPENDGHEVKKVTCVGRAFWCNSWMAAQANEFMEWTKYLGPELELDIKGDGLIAWIVNQGAEGLLKEEE